MESVENVREKSLDLFLGRFYFEGVFIVGVVEDWQMSILVCIHLYSFGRVTVIDVLLFWSAEEGNGDHDNHKDETQGNFSVFLDSDEN